MKLRYLTLWIVPILLSFYSNGQNGSGKNQPKVSSIDFKHWKVTLPIGAPAEVGYPEIMNYGNDESLKKYMYNDSSDGSVVFYAFPGATTSNSSHSRCELREQMEPGQNTPNWTFAQGGRMKGTLAMGAISKDSKGNYHKTIIMQIHGRLTEAQRILIGQKDNNAPPVLKISWEDGKVFVRTKILKDTNTSDKAVLTVDAWKDDIPNVFKQSAEWRVLKHQLDKKELLFFLKKYNKFVAQFDNQVTATEETNTDTAAIALDSTSTK
jgi:hypothetical protein